MVEYLPITYERITDAAVMAEYNVPVYIRQTDAAVEVEYRKAGNINITNAAVMVEYRDIGVSPARCGMGDNELVVYMEFDPDLSCYLSRADEPGLSVTGDLTFGTWVLFDSKSMGMDTGIISKWYEDDNERGYLLRKTSDGKFQFSISQDGVGLNFTVDDGGVNYHIGEWFYIVCKYTPSTSISMFINGNWYINTNNIPASIHDSTEPFEMARYTRKYYLDGYLSHSFLSAVSIEDYEIEAMYAHAKAMYAYALPVTYSHGSGNGVLISNAAVMVEYSSTSSSSSSSSSSSTTSSSTTSSSSTSSSSTTTSSSSSSIPP